MRTRFFIWVGLGLWMVVSGCGDSTGFQTPAAPMVTTTIAPTQTAPPPPSAPTPMPTTTPTTSVPAGPQTLRRATFMSANGYVTEGTARIQRENGEHTLELDSDFRTSNSAALDVRLCTNPNCTGDFMTLGALQRFGGRQTYPLSDAANAYSHVTIYCLAVRLPFGFGRLQ